MNRYNGRNTYIKQWIPYYNIKIALLLDTSLSTREDKKSSVFIKRICCLFSISKSNFKFPISMYLLIRKSL